MKEWIKKIRQKLHNSKAFSLVELLFSILILMLSTTVIIQCFNLGIGNYVRETQASEAQLLCSSLATSIQNELSYAQDIKITGNKLDTYYSCARRMGPDSQIVVENGRVFIKNTETSYPLVAEANYKADGRSGVGTSGDFFKAYLKDNAITWDDTNKVFKVTIWVDDARKGALDAAAAKEGALAYAEFSVKPMAGAD